MGFTLSLAVPGDYSDTVVLLTFGPGVLALNVSVPIANNNSKEDEEVFYGNLRLPAGSYFDGLVETNPERANAAIFDCNIHVLAKFMATKTSVPIWQCTCPNRMHVLT